MEATARGIEDRIWLRSYPAGVPASIDDALETCRSLADLFDRTTAKFAGRTAFVSIGREMSYQDLADRARAFAAWLQKTGIGRGQRVAIMLPNTLQYPVCLFGTLLAGATVVNVNPLYTVRELAYQLTDSGAEVLIVLANFAHTAERALPGTAVRHVLVTELGDLVGGIKGPFLNAVLRYKKLVPAYNLPQAQPLAAVLKRGATLPFRREHISHDDIAFLQYTGGTTGTAKGAMLTHRNMVANVLQALAWIGDDMVRAPHVIVTLLPLYHVFSLMVNCLMFFCIGSRDILIANPRDVKRVVKALRHEAFTDIAGINTLFREYLDNAEFCARDFSKLRFTMAGGMPMQKAIAARWQEVTGCVITEGYGLTETSPVATINPINYTHPETMQFSGTIGLPLPSTEVRMRRLDGGWAAPGEEGEICVRGPQVMAGYWRRPDETARVIDSDGWLATGDVGVMDERGYVRIVDRIKDMILVSGFNVYPSEIEDVVMMHPGVRECAAVGMADAHAGERVKLIVVARSAELTEAAIIAHCRAHLTGYKIPKVVEFRTAPLPKTNVGKTLRRALRDEGEILH